MFSATKMDKDPEPPGDNQYIDARGSKGFLYKPSGPVEQVFGTKIVNIIQGSTEQARANRNRQNVLKLVWNTWIEGVLKKSLYNEMLIELGMEIRPDAIEHPWDMVIQMPEQEPAPIAPGTKISELFEMMNGAMLILGEPGSGKTTMLLELARQLIERAFEDPSIPIPVLFNLSSWTPKQPIADWLETELRSKYYIPKKIAQVWIDNDELLLLLDGLDEVKAENRDACVDAINTLREEHNLQLVICSRTQEYEGLNKHLKLGGAVLLKPLTLNKIDEYLNEVGIEIAPLHQAIKHDPELQEFAQTPLNLTVMVLTYCNVQRESLRALQQARNFQERLFDDYIKQMFKRRGVQLRFTPELTISYLALIAQSMIKHGQMLFFIEDIQPNILELPKAKLRLIFGPVMGLIFGLVMGLVFGLVMGLITGPFMGDEFSLLWPVVGLVGGLIGGLVWGLIRMGAWTEFKPIERISWSWKGSLRWLFIGLIFGLISAEIFGLICLGLSIGTLIVGLIDGLIFELIFGSVFGLIGGLRGSTQVENRQKPGQGINTTIRFFSIIWMISGLFGILIIGLMPNLITWLSTGSLVAMPVHLIVDGLIIGLIFGLIFGFFKGGDYFVAHIFSRLYLYSTGHIPWNIIAFLDYATDRIFLRRVGGGYIFIHRMLMEHFAGMAEPGEIQGS